MAIGPLDLQIMYSQMNNVAKTVANQQQGAQLAQQLQESKIIQREAERAAAVKKAADDEAKTRNIDKDGHQQGFYGGQGGARGGGTDADDDAPPHHSGFREAYLGNHVDISG